MVDVGVRVDHRVSATKACVVFLEGHDRATLAVGERHGPAHPMDRLGLHGGLSRFLVEHRLRCVLSGAGHHVHGLCRGLGENERGVDLYDPGILLCFRPCSQRLRIRGQRVDLGGWKNDLLRRRRVVDAHRKDLCDDSSRSRHRVLCERQVTLVTLVTLAWRVTMFAHAPPPTQGSKNMWRLQH